MLLQEEAHQRGQYDIIVAGGGVAGVVLLFDSILSCAVFDSEPGKRQRTSRGDAAVQWRQQWRCDPIYHCHRMCRSTARISTKTMIDLL